MPLLLLSLLPVKMGCKALYTALLEQATGKIKALCEENGLDVNALDCHEKAPFFYAYENGDEGMLVILFSYGK